MAHLAELGYDVVAAVAQYPDDVRALPKLGIDVVINLYEGAGEQLVDEALDACRERSAAD